MEHLSDFSKHAWCQALFTSAHHIPHRTLSREPLSSSSSRTTTTPSTDHGNIKSSAFSLYNSTLATPRGLRAVQSFSLRACAAHGLPRAEWQVLHSLGDGLNGPREIVHGGMLMTMLDSAMAVAALLRVGIGTCTDVDDTECGIGRRCYGTSSKVSGNETCQKLDIYASSLSGPQLPVSTTSFAATFLRRVRAPCVVLVRAWIERETRGGAEYDKEGGRDCEENGRTELHVRSVLEDGQGRAHVEATAIYVRGRRIAKETEQGKSIQVNNLERDNSLEEKERGEKVRAKL